MRYEIEGKPHQYDTGWSDQDLTAEEMLAMLPGTGSAPRYLVERAIEKLRSTDIGLSTDSDNREG